MGTFQFKQLIHYIGGWIPVTFVLASFFILSTSQVSAQGECNLILNGTIADEHTREPLHLARIEVVGAGKGAMTGESGEYEVRNLCPGEWILRITHLGCDTMETKVNLVANLHLDFQLGHSSMETVHIEEEAPRQRATQAESILSKKELWSTRGGTLASAMEQEAGVTALKTGNSISKPMIHGLHGNRVLILNNGVRQEGQQWGNEHGPEIDPFIADQLIVVKGANGVRYGSDAIAGVILVEPRPMRDTSGIAGEVNLVGASNGRMGVANAMLEGKWKKIPLLSVRVQGTLRSAGNAHTPDYFLKNTGFRESNFSGAAGWQGWKLGGDVYYSLFTTDLAIFSGSHIGNLTDLYRAFEAERPLDSAGFSYEIGRPYQHVQHELFKARTWWRPGNSGKLTFQYSRQYNLRQEFDKHRPRNDSLAALDLPDLHYEITTHSAEAIFEHNRFHGFTGTFGVSGIGQANTYEGRFFIPNFRARTFGVFAIERWRHKQFQVEAGGRFDDRTVEAFMWSDSVIVSPDHHWRNFSGTAGAIWYPGEHWTLRMNAGTAWRAPNVNELYSNGLHHGAAAIEAGDSSLRAERAYNFIASAVVNHEHRVHAQADVYYNYISDFIYLQPVLPAQLTIRGAFPSFQYMQADARFTGIDLSGEVWMTSFLSWTTRNSMLRAWNITANDYLILMPADRFTQGLALAVRDGKRFRDTRLTAAATYVRRQNRVPQNSDYVPPPDDYLTVEAGIATTLHFGNQRIIFGAGVDNLLNARYRDYLNRFRYYADEMGRNFTFRISVPFDTHHLEHEHEIEHPH